MSSFLVCDTNCSEEQTIKKAYFLYDAAGCVTAIDRDDGPDLDLTWNGQYQLTSVSTNGIVAESYTYDPFGRRASTTSAGTTIRHVYDGIHCVADIDSVGRVVKSYTWGPGIDNLLAVTCHSGPLATTYYALTDLQGTVHGFADADGNLVARYAYDAWGNLLDADVAVSALADNRFLFQGREYSCSTGLTNFRLRWYDPATGRWLSKDPIGISGGLNLYAFCDNDPVNHVDPLGEEDFRLNGERIRVHKFDADPKPSTPHGHYLESGKKLARDGTIYNNGRAIGKLPKADLSRWGAFLKRAGFLALVVAAAPSALADSTLTGHIETPVQNREPRSSDSMFLPKDYTFEDIFGKEKSGGKGCD